MSNVAFITIYNTFIHLPNCFLLISFIFIIDNICILFLIINNTILSFLVIQIIFKHLYKTAVIVDMLVKKGLYVVKISTI